jgi:phage-related protein
MIFNGFSTVDAGVVIQTPPVYEFPSRRSEVIQIQGKNGDIVIDKNSFNNVNREYNLASVFRKNDSFIGNVRVLVDWLSSVSGYARLEDSYEPEYFRLAMFRSGGQLPNFYDKATAMVVRFECKPQRFLKTGEIGIEFTRSTNPDSNFHKIENHTKYLALPEINVTGGVVSIEVRSGDDYNNPDNKTILTVTDNTILEKITIDSDIQDVYTDSSFLNNKVEVTNGFPKLYPGNNWIRITYLSAETVVTIKPRWWVL